MSSGDIDPKVLDEMKQAQEKVLGYTTKRSLGETWHRMEEVASPEERQVTDKVKSYFLKNISIGTAIGTALSGAMVYGLRSYIPKAPFYLQPFSVVSFSLIGGMTAMVISTEPVLKTLLTELPKSSPLREALLEK